MKVKKLIATTAMALVGLMTFSSCWFLVDQEKAIERISDVQSERQVNRTVVTDNKMFIDVNGERKEVDFLTEAKKYYAVGNQPNKGRFQRYGDWIYYEYGYDYEERLIRQDASKVALMRSNIYTGATENLCDFGETYLSVYSSGIQGGRYFFFYVQGVLKIFDMATNQFVYEDCIEKESEIEKLTGYELYNYSFYSYNNGHYTWDYVKDGKYYYYLGDGTYQELNVPDWIIAEEGTISHISLSRIENYVYTLSYNDIEEERKAYDLAEGVEVDYMTVVKPLRESNDEERGVDYEEEVFVTSPGILVQTEDKSYEIKTEKYSGYIAGRSSINRYDLDEKGWIIEESVFTMDDAYLKAHSEPLRQLCELWNKTGEGVLECGLVCSSGGRVFFYCYTYYGTFVASSISAVYLFELDPITFEFAYLGYYLSSIDALYVL